MAIKLSDTVECAADLKPLNAMRVGVRVCSEQGVMHSTAVQRYVEERARGIKLNVWLWVQYSLS